MATHSIHLFRHQIGKKESRRFVTAHNVLFVMSGSIVVGRNEVSAGEGVLLDGNDIHSVEGADVLAFQVGFTSANGAILSERFQLSEPEVVLRLDQVSFPPGACAYRHTHPGPGIRCLIEGTLQIQSDHHTEEMRPMSAWFEDAESPVKATAGNVPTSFVRAMVLPQAYFGKPTLNILDPEDAAKPMLQKSRRFVDQVIHLSSN